MTASIQTRFLASLVSNLARAAITFSTGLLLARWLGPDDYGRMAFLLASFMAFKQLLDMATTSAFFTFLSKRQRSQTFISYFWRWVAIQFVIAMALVALILPDSTLSAVWVGESRSLIILALIATFMQQHVWSVAAQMAEANRETIKLQKLNIAVVILHLLVVVTLWLFGQLFLPIIFIALAVEWMLAAWLASRLYTPSDGLANKSEVSDTPQSVFKEFWHYCLPFIPYAWLGVVHDFADRWMLQHWGGASEQAYYAVAQQFSAVALLATTSILRIFWKEIAEAQHQGDQEKVKRLYLQVSRGLYFVGAVVAGGLIPWSYEIIQLLLGDAYLAGSFTLMIMFLYPVHQSMGQIGGTMLYATENTRIQVVLGIAFMISSIIVVYFMLAPVAMTVPGLELGSEGLAYKMVAMQLIQVNIMAWFIARIFGWKFDWFYQIAGLGLAIALGYMAKSLTTFLVLSDIASMASAAIIYAILIMATLFLLPWLVGMERDNLKSFVMNAMSIISRGRVQNR